MITAAASSQDAWTIGDYVIIGFVVVFVIVFIGFIIKPPR